jgi:hypothetical protein
MRAYIAYDSALALTGVIIFGLIFGILARFNFGRRLLLNHPKFFTFGAVSHEGPTDEFNEHSIMEIYFSGEGWKETMNDSSDQFKIPVNKKMITRVTSRNPGYGACSDSILSAAITIIKEHDKMPDKGGVLSPAAAFRKTTLISRLQDTGMKFEVLDEKEF